MKPIRPLALKPNDKIGIVSIASPMAHYLPNRVERGLKTIQDMGFQPVIGAHALNEKGLISASAEDRASDINQFFADPSIKGIMTFIGGYGVGSVFEHIDFDVVRANPKMFISHSESAVFNMALYSKANMVSFYGPHVLTQFAETKPHPYTTKHFMRAVCDAQPLGLIKPSKEWSDDFLDWFAPNEASQQKQWHPNKGYNILKHGLAEGVVLGGCLDPMHILKGTEYWPDFQDSILFLELSPSPEHPSKPYPLGAVYAQFQSLSLCGVFGQISGLILGRSVNYTPQDNQALQEMITEVTNAYDFPIMIEADIGHTDPMITLPIGVRARMNTSQKSFEIIEPHLR